MTGWRLAGGSLRPAGAGRSGRLEQAGRLELDGAALGKNEKNLNLCKIADDMLPSPPVLKVLTCMSKVIPKAKLVPITDLAELAFREADKRKMAVYNVICYNDRMRLRTAVELINVTSDIEKQVEKVSSPLLVLHGAADKVTDPLVSKFLYEKASSKDKTLKLYNEGHHCILEGEPDDRILTVLNDIVSWLDSRSSIVRN